MKKKLLLVVGSAFLLITEPAVAATNPQFQLQIVPQECTIDTVDNGQGLVQVITCPEESGEEPQGPIVIPQIPRRTARPSGSGGLLQPPSQPQEDTVIPAPTGDADYRIDPGGGELAYGPLAMTVIALAVIALLLLIANSISIALYGHGLFAAVTKYRRRKHTQ